MIPFPALMHLAYIAGLSQLHANVLFFAFIAQGNTRVASFIQLAHEHNKPSATVFDINTGRIFAA